jgi:RHS repeat-associated protein
VYDKNNRRTQHIQHKAGGNLITQYTQYLPEDLLATTVDASGAIFTYEYDALNRQTDQRFSAGSGNDISQINTTYDGNSNIDIVTEYNSRGIEPTDFNYDDLDRQIAVIQRGHTTTFTYDAVGNRTQVATSGGITSYQFDNRNRLAKAITSEGDSTYTYLANSWLDTVSYPNGTSTTTIYDTVGRPTLVSNEDSSSNVISNFAYTYDDNGNRLTQTETQNGFSANQVQTTDYSYDRLDRLTNTTITDDASGDTHSTEFTHYTSFDRKTQLEKVNDAVTLERSYHYNDVHWLTRIDDALSSNSINYNYDNNGNTLSKQDGNTSANTAYTYNQRNQLTEVTVNNSSQGQYGYNYRGMRIQHSGSSRGNVEYFHDGSAIIDEKSNGAQYAHYNYGSRLLSLSTPSDTQYYHFSALNTTANLSDSSGSIKASYRTDAFGEITQQEGTSENRQVFTGHEHDEETGLVYMKARFYDPDAGRFLNHDSYLGTPDTAPSLHRYLYAYGNPTYYTDPDGHAAYYFAGTGNHLNEKEDYRGKEDKGAIHSNVEKLYEATKGDKYYAYGIGTGFEADGEPYARGAGLRITAEGVSGGSMDERIEWMMGNLETQLLDGDNTVDLFGFSRGAASGVDFLNRIQDKIDSGNELYQDVDIRFVGLFDTVSSKRNGLIYSNSNADVSYTGHHKNKRRVVDRKADFRFDLPENMKFSNQPVHAVSIDERRKEFAVQDLKGAKQVGFRGVHSDVGGGDKNNAFDWLARDFMVQEAEQAGVKFNQKALSGYSRNGSQAYEQWIKSDQSPALRSNAIPTNNRKIYFNDNEDRKLPSGMQMHESVPYFLSPQLNQ